MKNDSLFIFSKISGELNLRCEHGKRNFYALGIRQKNMGF